MMLYELLICSRDTPFEMTTISDVNDWIMWLACNYIPETDEVIKN